MEVCVVQETEAELGGLTEPILVGEGLELVDQQTRRMERLVYSAVPEAVASLGGIGYLDDESEMIF